MLTRLTKYGTHANTFDVLKAVAGVAMICDHVGSYFFPQEPWLRIVGRFAAPCFFFLIGYARSTKLPTDWLIFGAWLSIMQVFGLSVVLFNILFNFYLIRLVFSRIPPEELPIWALSVLIAVMIGADQFVHPYIEYGFVGWLWAISGRLVRVHEKSLAAIVLVAVAGLHTFTTITLFAFVHAPHYATATALVFASCALAFFSFREEPWHVPNALRPTTLFLSRYSLEFYTWHIGAFATIAMIRFAISAQ